MIVDGGSVQAAVCELLDTAQRVIEEAATELQLRCRIIRKPRAVGLVPGGMSGKAMCPQGSGSNRVSEGGRGERGEMQGRARAEGGEGRVGEREGRGEADGGKGRGEGGMREARGGRASRSGRRGRCCGRGKIVDGVRQWTAL